MEIFARVILPGGGELTTNLEGEQWLANSLSFIPPMGIEVAREKTLEAWGQAQGESQRQLEAGLAILDRAEHLKRSFGR